MRVEIRMASGTVSDVNRRTRAQSELCQRCGQVCPLLRASNEHRSSTFPLEGGLGGLPLRVSNEGWFIWSISSIWLVWLVGPEIHPEEPERPANQTDEPGRVARAQKIIRLHLFFCSASRRTARLPFPSFGGCALREQNELTRLAMT